jgi:organic radical activating enzyme
MQILNVRFGLATNSSSNHSLIFLPEGVEAKDYPGYHHAQTGWDDDGEYEFGDFGWQRFTLASPKLKLRYLGCLLKDRLEGNLPTNVARLVHESWLGVPPEDEDGIDHGSWHYIPCAFGTEIPDEQLVRELKEFFLQDRLVVLGGNDNESAAHPLDNGSAFELPIPRDCGNQAGYICRYDEEYKFWTVFHPVDGTKIRFRLTNDPETMKVKADKASTPELVDVKITSYCNQGCEFCYQSSTTEGSHADSYDLRRLAEELSAMKVFEVAIGGGEPVIHPSFTDILQAFRENGIVPNFTTRNLDWLRHPKMAREITEACGAFAYSISDPKDKYGEHSGRRIQELLTLLDYNGIPRQKAAIQLVMGTMSKYAFEKILRETNERGLCTTLLGYKNVGFGADFTPEDYDWWINCVKEATTERRHGANISIDTVLVAQFEEALIEADMPSWMFETKEGGFSCYIDMVDKKIGPSSYCDPSEMKDLPHHQGEWGNEDYIERYGIILREFAAF